jgi:hypothetical protein
MAAQIVFRTQGTATSFISTTNAVPVFLTSSLAVRFLSTINSTPIFLSSSKKEVFVTTTNSTPVFLTNSQAIVFLVTPDTGTTKLLVPKIGDLTFDSGQTYVEVPDATGTYNATTNPGGYNPAGDPPVTGRPERSEVYLWTVYRIWSKPTADGYGSNTQTPDSQAEEADDPYTYTLTFPTEEIENEAVPIRGIYEIIMMAVPDTLSYSNYVGNANLATMAKEFPDWYVTSVGVMVDPDVVNCLNKKRYQFLQGIMCGKCDEEYLYFYGIYVGMLNAMEVQEWDRAVEFYEKLKELCACVSECGC